MTSTMFEFFLCTHGAGIKVADKEMPRPTVENASQGARTRSSRTLPMVRPCVAAWIASSLSLLANDADRGTCVKTTRRANHFHFAQGQLVQPSREKYFA
jgi:hypothetical protein